MAPQTRTAGPPSKGRSLAASTATPIGNKTIGSKNTPTVVRGWQQVR